MKTMIVIALSLALLSPALARDRLSVQTDKRTPTTCTSKDLADRHHAHHLQAVLTRGCVRAFINPPRLC